MPDIIVRFSLSTAVVLGMVDERGPNQDDFTPTFSLDKKKDKKKLPPQRTFPLRITSFRGPTGPVPSIAFSGVDYRGKLTNGNHFGTCEVIIQGTFLRVKFGALPKFGIFRAICDLEISSPKKPKFKLSGPKLVIKKGSPGPPEKVGVTVEPAGKYQILFTAEEPLKPGSDILVPARIQVLPTVLTTDENGRGTIEVRDLSDLARGDIIVTGQISPQSPCTGTPVTNTFEVKVK